MHLLDEDLFVPFLVFAIPLVAIAGGILARIIRSICDHRLLEVAVRERMALVARGVDPARIAGLPAGAGAGLFPPCSFADHSRLRARIPPAMATSGIANTRKGTNRSSSRRCMAAP
jgi:hypothetical protein